MADDITQLAIEKVRKNKDDCDHVGFYMPNGMEMIQAPDGSVLCITGVICMLCGKIFLPKTVIVQPSAPEVTEQSPKILTGKN